MIRHARSQYSASVPRFVFSFSSLHIQVCPYHPRGRSFIHPPHSTRIHQSGPFSPTPHNHPHPSRTQHNHPQLYRALARTELGPFAAFCISALVRPRDQLLALARPLTAIDRRQMKDIAQRAAVMRSEASLAHDLRRVLLIFSTRYQTKNRGQMSSGDWTLKRFQEKCLIPVSTTSYLCTAYCCLMSDTSTSGSARARVRAPVVRRADTARCLVRTRTRIRMERRQRRQQRQRVVAVAAPRHDRQPLPHTSARPRRVQSSAMATATATVAEKAVSTTHSTPALYQTPTGSRAAH